MNVLSLRWRTFLKRLRSIVPSGGRVFLRKNPWTRRMAFVVLSMLGGLFIFNVGLNLGASKPFLASLISVSPQSFALDYERAWSFWPTIVYVRNFSARGSDANVQWQVEIDEARVSINLTALLKREFHATKVRARGIGFRARQKLDASAATGDRVAALPLIPGFEGLPLREEGPPPPPISDKNYNLWSVRIEDVDGRARQIWIDEFRFEGDARVAGAFELRPARRLWVGPAYATIFSGNVAVGNETLLNHTSGTANCTIPPFDLRLPVGMEVFRYISGNVRLDADIPSARALAYYARIRGSRAVFDGGKGLLHLDGTLRSGVVRPITLLLTFEDVTIEQDAWRFLGSVRISTKTEDAAPNVWHLRVAPFELRQSKAKSSAVLGREILLQASTDVLDLSKPAVDFEIHGDLPSALVPNLRIVNAFLPSKSKLQIDGGKSTLAVHFDANTRANWAKGVFTVDVDGLSAHNNDLHFGGRLNVVAHVAKMFFENGAFELTRAVIDARDVSMRDSNTAIYDWWSSVELRDVSFRPGRRVLLDVPFKAKLANATPVLAFSKRSPSIPDWVTRFLTGGEAQASGHLRAGKMFMELSNLKAQTGILRVEGELHERDDATSGVLRVSAGPLSIGFELKNEETKLVFFGKPVEPQLATATK